MIRAFLYQMIIYPIELLMEFVFSLVCQAADNPGIAVMSVSLAFTLFSLPLYQKADELQEAQRRQEEALAAWKGHIQRTFHGDERFLMLQEYYRQNGYKPWHALRGSLSLLLQIPFFIAAYHYLSHCGQIRGASFLWLRDMGRPDGLLTIGSLSVNVMPFLMTGINLLSVLVFSRGKTLKENLQFYLLAGLFLVLLYQSPSGLVLYWTMNQVFSLLKSVVRQLRTSGAISLSAKHAERSDPKTGSVWLLLGGGLLSAVTVGLFIPSAVIASSPLEFVDEAAFVHPFSWMMSILAAAMGIFVFWPFVLYRLGSGRGKETLAAVMSGCGIVAIAHWLVFGERTGTISPMMEYDRVPVYAAWEILSDLVLVAVMIAGIWLVCRYLKRVRKLIVFLCFVAVLGAGVMSIRTMIRIDRAVKTVKPVEETESEEMPEKLITIDRSGKNVVVLMMDRMISGFLPYILEEDPTLRQRFDGFTWYPNTVSYGMYTNIGTTALFGGYEYTPERIAQRKDKTVGEKHDEALLLLPRIFTDHGYAATVLNPSYAGWSWIPDLSIFEPYPEIRAYTPNGRIRSSELDEVEGARQEKQTRAILCHGLCMISPLLWREGLYDDGNYHSTAQISGIADFLRSYEVMDQLSELTEITDTGTGQFLSLCNEMTHDTAFLQVPSYQPSIYRSETEDGSVTPQIRVDGEGRELLLADDDNNFILRHYECDMAAMQLIADWLDTLRQNGVYDNTRIIIISDHGRGFHLFSDLVSEDLMDITWFNPMLLVKDFGSTGFEVDNRFMTEADVPALSLEDLITDPVNPYTGNPVDMTDKEHEQLINATDNPYFSEEYYFPVDVDEFFAVQGNLFYEGNWRRLSPEERAEVLGTDE